MYSSDCYTVIPLPKYSLSVGIIDIISKWILHVEWIRNSHSCYCSPGDSAFLV